MIGLIRQYRKWVSLAAGALVAVAGFALVATQPVHAAGNTGEIKGGKYTVQFKNDKLPVNGDDTTVTLQPPANGSKVSVSDNGVIDITNVPPGTYNVTVTVKITKDLCNKNWFTTIISTLTPALQIFCKTTGVGDTYYQATKTFPNIVVTAGQVTYLEGTDATTDRSLGQAIQVDANGNPVIDCSGKGILMSFVICPMIENVLGIVDWIISNFIQPYLAINPLTTTSTQGCTGGAASCDSQLYLIWNNIRNFANIVFILAFFVIVFSQATSIGISNYGIKRLLPRLILIAIGTNISFFVCAFLVDVFNVLGVGIASLLVNAITNGSLTINLGNGDLFLAIGLNPLALVTPFGPLLAAAAAAVVFGVFAFLMISVAILFIAAIVILLRQLVLIFLVLASPAAFVAGLLPNTQKYLYEWFEAFVKLLAMYPILMALFASGKIASDVLQKIGPIGSGNAPDLVSTIVVFLAFILPLIMTPFAFKFAGSGMHKLYGALQNGAQNARKQATGAAVKGAKMTPWGQEAQQHLNNFRAGRVRQAADRASQRRSSDTTIGRILRRVNSASGNEAARLEYQARTTKSLEGRNPHAVGDIARMDQGETVDHYAQRSGLLAATQTTGMSPDEVRNRNNAQQRLAALREMHTQFGNQVGSDEFREAALTSALAAGANTEDIHQGFQAYIDQHRGNDAELTQATGRLAKAAKAAGFAEYSAVGYQTDPATGARQFSQYQIKPPGAILRNIDYKGQETGQFIVQTPEQAAVRGTPVGSRTELGEALHTRLAGGVDPTTGAYVAPDDATRLGTLRSIAVGGRESKAYGEYVRIAREADAALNAQGLGALANNESELVRMVSQV